MKTPVNKDNILYFAETNVSILEKPRALTLEFSGLGDTRGVAYKPGKLGEYCAERGVIYAIPYYDPWAWMNDKAVRFVDEVVDAIFAYYGLAEGDVPIISTGLSMGGLGALVYCAASRHKVAACAANCPVCDLPYHYTERDDTPRTLYNAFSHYDMTLGEALEANSPMHMIDRMPDIPYAIFAATDDCEVSKEKHSDRFVPAMRAAGRDVEYVVMEGRGHCDLSPEAVERWHGFITSFRA